MATLLLILPFSGNMMDQIINLIKAVYIDGVNFIEIEREIHILTNDALHTLLTHNPKEAKVNQEKCIISL
jgi:hypothetical protein